jgi:DNA repair protein RecO (recombination protein O)
MLVGALRTLADNPNPLVSAAFFWKLLSLEGFHPLLDACARCGDDEGPFTAFDLEEGGVVCTTCGRFSGRRIEPDTLLMVRRILGGELRVALAEPPGPVTVATERLAVTSLEHHLERRLRSATLL